MLFCGEQLGATQLPAFLLQDSAIPSACTYMTGTSTIDKYARVLFPLSFGAFNLIYWLLYLTKDTMEPPRCHFCATQNPHLYLCETCTLFMCLIKFI